MVMYAKFADIYDSVMRQIDYPMWANHVLDLAADHCQPLESVLSLACGTGSLEVELAEKGLQITCLDASEEMLEIAQTKFHRLSKPMPIVQARMSEFALEERFDLVLCLYDSLNYLLTREEVCQAFQRAFDHLRPEGIYIFDVTTEFNILQHFADPFPKKSVKRPTIATEKPLRKDTWPSMMGILSLP